MHLTENYSRARHTSFVIFALIFFDQTSFIRLGVSIYLPWIAKLLYVLRSCQSKFGSNIWVALIIAMLITFVNALTSDVAGTVDTSDDAQGMCLGNVHPAECCYYTLRSVLGKGSVYFTFMIDGSIISDTDILEGDLIVHFVKRSATLHLYVHDVARYRICLADRIPVDMIGSESWIFEGDAMSLTLVRLRAYAMAFRVSQNVKCMPCERTEISFDWIALSTCAHWQRYFLWWKVTLTVTVTVTVIVMVIFLKIKAKRSLSVMVVFRLACVGSTRDSWLDDVVRPCV